MAAGSSSVRADILWLCRAREPRRAGEAPAAARGGGRGRSSGEAPALCTHAWVWTARGRGGRRAGARAGAAPGAVGGPSGQPPGLGGVGWEGRRSRGPAEGGGGTGASPCRGSAAAGRVVAGRRGGGAGRAHAGARCEAEYGGVRGAPGRLSLRGPRHTRGRCLPPARPPVPRSRSRPEPGAGPEPPAPFPSPLLSLPG